MKFRQFNRYKDCEGWTELTTVKGIKCHKRTITFTCETERTKGAYGSCLNYAILIEWLSSCSIEEQVLRLRTKYLDIEIHPDAWETDEQLERIKKLINDAKRNTGKNPDTVKNALKKIDDLIGLDNIKQEVRSIVNLLQVNQMRQSAGMPSISVSRHMVFYGNPGTGKTTIARRLGELFCLLGILSKGHFVETDRSSLVGGYLGQTAIKTSQVLESALGGILFIDEAYTLSRLEGNDHYGQEAIDTILKYMEDHRDDIVIIVAGYEDLMGKFLESNPGLKSRFNKYFHFKDYSEEELLQIFLAMASESNYELDEEAQDHLREVAAEMLRLTTKNFGNGRTVRNLFEKSIGNHANRIMQKKTSCKDDLARLSKEDILWEDMLEASR